MEVVTRQRMPIAMFMYFLAGNCWDDVRRKEGSWNLLKIELSLVERGKVINERWKLDLESKACQQRLVISFVTFSRFQC